MTEVGCKVEVEEIGERLVDKLEVDAVIDKEEVVMVWVEKCLLQVYFLLWTLSVVFEMLTRKTSVCQLQTDWCQTLSVMTLMAAEMTLMT